MSVFALTKAELSTVQGKHGKFSIISTPERRQAVNRSVPADIELIKQHIESFPAYKSHYGSSQTSRKYLSSNLSLQKMYDLYKDFAAEKGLPAKSVAMYKKAFYQEYNLGFKPPVRNSCETCEKLKQQINCADPEDSKIALQGQLEVDETAYRSAYESKQKDKEVVKNDHSTLLWFSISSSVFLRPLYRLK